MNTQKQYYSIIFIFFGLGTLFGLLAMYVAEIFAVFLVIVAVASAFMIINLKCSCGAPLLQRYIPFLGLKIPFYLPWLSKKCPKCGKEIE